MRNGTYRLGRLRRMETKRSSDALRGFPIVVIENVAWGDRDAFGHVNNTVYLRWFEDARVAYLDSIGFLYGPMNVVGPVLHSVLCRFRRPLGYPDTLRVGARVTEITDERMTMEHRVVSEKLGEVAAEGASVIVAYDYTKHIKVPLPTYLRNRLDPLEKGVEEAKTARLKPRTRR